MPLWRHMDELRRRLLIAVVAVACTSVPIYIFRDNVMGLILAQSQVGSLTFIHPAEAFMSYLRLSITVGFLIALPVIMFQIGRFLAPGLTAVERRALHGASVFGAVLFYAGCAFGFLVLSRVALSFLLSVPGPNLRPQITVSNYISFVSCLTFLIGISFELPLVVVVLVRFGLVRTQTLRARRRHMIVGLWIIAAILTPSPDGASQAMVAVPLMLLYELSILLGRLVERRLASRAEPQDAERK